MRPVTLFAILVTLLFGAAGISRFVKQVTFVQGCGGYLKRAADANTISLAEKELSRGIQYIEENNLTNGYTSVVYRTPDEDMGFWYNNLKESLTELRAINPEATQLEKSNVLMKLRETLLDNGERGDSLTYPDGIAVYPMNAIYGVFLLIFGVLTVFLWISVLVTYD